MIIVERRYPNLLILFYEKTVDYYGLFRALLLKRENIPKARMEELERILFDFYGAQDITVDILNDAANLDVK